jgi:GrpB-like predicted nucleotidyltransferase (UPF0157 family)
MDFTPPARMRTPHRPYTIQDYSSDWPKLFQQVRARIREVLEGAALAIHHVGSTAIPGMPAKPQIDVLVIVDDLADIRHYYKAMKNAGFTPRGDYNGKLLAEEYFTRDDSDGRRLVSVHVLPKGHPEIEGKIAFRDYLCDEEHRNDRDRYAEKKRALLRQHPDAIGEYDQGKRDVIAAIRSRAISWHRRRHERTADEDETA